MLKLLLRSGVKKSYTFVKPLHLEGFLFMRDLEKWIFMEERTLIRQVAEGSREAFRVLMDRYLPLVSRTSYRIMCDRKDSERITVYVMLSLWRDTRSFNNAHILSHQLLKRTCRMCRRSLLRRRILTVLSIDPDIFVASSPLVPSYDEYVARQAWQVFCRASSGLSDRQRMAYTLCELEGIPESAAAPMCGFGLVSLEDALSQAREAVGEELEHYGRMSDYDAYVGFLRKVEDQLTDRVGLQRRIMGFVSDED